MNIRAARSFRGTFRMPGDKSITHRAFIFGALAEGVTTIEGASAGGDCTSTKRCLGSLGVRFESDSDGMVLRAHGAGALKAPGAALDCGNSGTTLRLLMGLLAGSTVDCELSGDESLSRRPMERVARPLRMMGAQIETTHGRPPVRIFGTRLRGAAVTPEAASAQIKSAILLAALGADGTTTIHEAVATRDHTERMIRSFGGVLRREGHDIRVEGPQKLKATRVSIPGDPSSAAPFVVAALVLPDSEIVIEDLLLNPHRIRYLDVLREMGARIETEITSTSEEAEPSGRIIVRGSDLRGIEVSPSDVAAIVDELPILAVAGAFARGRFRVIGADELRVKESDRITSMVEGLQAMGADIQELADGFSLQGGRLRGATVGSHGDHRIAMALSVAALGAVGDSRVLGAEVVSISLPDFFSELERGARR